MFITTIENHNFLLLKNILLRFLQIKQYGKFILKSNINNTTFHMNSFIFHIFI